MVMCWRRVYTWKSYLAQLREIIERLELTSEINDWCVFYCLFRSLNKARKELRYRAGPVNERTFVVTRHFRGRVCSHFNVYIFLAGFESFWSWKLKTVLIRKMNARTKRFFRVLYEIKTLFADSQFQSGIRSSKERFVEVNAQENWTAVSWTDRNVWEITICDELVIKKRRMSGWWLMQQFSILAFHRKGLNGAPIQGQGLRSVHHNQLYCIPALDIFKVDKAPQFQMLFIPGCCRFLHTNLPSMPENHRRLPNRVPQAFVETKCYKNFCYLSFDCEWHRFADSPARIAVHPSIEPMFQNDCNAINVYVSSSFFQASEISFRFSFFSFYPAFSSSFFFNIPHFRNSLPFKLIGVYCSLSSPASRSELKYN